MEKVIFLDRDGVINKYPGDTKYVTCWEEFRFLPKSIEAIKKLTRNGFKVFVVSNQAGIKKNVYSKKNLDIITKNMKKKIVDSGGKIHKALYCLHTQEDKCSCRKPNTGLIKKALKQLKSMPDLKNTYLIGDSLRDVQTGKNAGLKTILVRSGKDKSTNINLWQQKPDFVTKNLFNAVNIVLKNQAHKNNAH